MSFLRAVSFVIVGLLLAATTVAFDTGQASAAVSVPLLVNFQSQTAATPSGYKSDYGQAYDSTRGFGWTTVSGTPLSLVGNGRERNAESDQRLDTLMQMQLPAGGTGVHTEGRWRAAIANGNYQVTVAVGDPSYIDSHHVVRLQGNKVIDFVPTSTTKFKVVTAPVSVTGGYLYLDALNGTNTKLDYLEVRPATSSPTVIAVTPTNGATNVSTASAVTVQLSAGVDPTTVTSTNFKLIGPGGVQIAGYYNVDGAYSNATFAPSTSLAASTTYSVQTTSGLKDPQGHAYAPFSSSFTTGTSGATQAPAKFTKSTFDVRDAPTAMALEPGSAALWAAFGNGAIVRYPLDSTGHKTGTPTVVSTFTDKRVVSGLRFDPTSTAGSLKLWVSNGQYGCDLAAMGVACTDYTGAISVLTGSSASSLTKRDVITGLPRSVGNHMNNGIDFGPDGKLYIAEGANNGYGSPDAIWGNRAEDPLTAAVLVADVKSISGTLSVDTSKGYNPNASGALVKVYASGVRNAFSVLWHSNGKLYAPVNESASGNTPAGASNNPPALSNLPAYNDYFTQIVGGKYYGHPNPARSQYGLNGGNPTSAVDPFEVREYPVGTQPNANWRKPDMDLGLHRSPDGSSEFKSSVFGTAMKGRVLVTEYSQGKDVIAVQLDSTGKAVSSGQVATGFYNPLPIVSEATSGRVYVGEYGRDPDGAGGKITLLTPDLG